MRKKYKNEITEFFRKEHPRGSNFYIMYDNDDIEVCELYVMLKDKLVAKIWLTFREKIFFINVKNDRFNKDIDRFEKKVNKKFVDKWYDFEKDVMIK